MYEIAEKIKTWQANVYFTKYPRRYLYGRFFYCFICDRGCGGCVLTILTGVLFLPKATAPLSESQFDFLWRTASKSSMAALTDALRESTVPDIGILMWASADLRQESESPLDSAPITIAVPVFMSVS